MKNIIFDTWLINGNITVFCGSHEDSFKKDILSSSLFGELVASKKSDNPVVSWPTYTATVQKIGWMGNSRGNQRLDFENSSLLSLIGECAGSTLSKDERQALTNAWGHLTNLQPDSPAIRAIVEKLQRNATVSESNPHATASTAALLTIIRNDKTVVTLQVTFETTHELESELLVQPVLNAINNDQTNSWQLCCLLDERYYNEIREDVLKKLGCKIETKLLHIPAPPDLN
ncbi:hypothetical protein [Pseudomonas sp. A-R-19]|uniref:hypothetical protein n=1 Tax=Pseudomonas sp. A-R-19 TaxID=2832403 RepID=UPI001CBFD592|nr:hypothetical protein [Pseudomonas sp. A-R-19]